MYSLNNGLCLAWLFVLLALNTNSLVCHVVVGRYRPDRTRTLHGVRSGTMTSSSVRLQPPEPFNFKSLDEWPRWRRRFLQFRDTSGLSDEGKQNQISTLFYCMGESAEDVLTSTDISADDRKGFESVLTKFDQTKPDALYTPIMCPFPWERTWRRNCLACKPLVSYCLSRNPHNHVQGWL